MRQRVLLCVAWIAGMLCVSSAAWGKITVKLVYDFDWTTDPAGLFDSATAKGLEARAALEYAAKVYSDRFLDSFTAIGPDGTNHFYGYFQNPGSGEYPYPPEGVTSVGANTIKVYVGARSMGPTTLGEAVVGGFSVPVPYTQSYLDNVRSRGQAGMLTPVKTDYAIWGGSLALNTDIDWFTGLTTTGLAGTTKIDMVSVAMHELGHLLGFTSGPTDDRTSFYSLISSNTFTGPRASALYGGAVPVQSGSFPAHWDDVTSTVGGVPQKALMNASMPQGVRRKLTDLDWAALYDIGWRVARPGDANTDGWVDFADLVAVAQNYGVSGGATWSMGDFDYDGAVSFADLVVLAQNYNTGEALSGAAASMSVGSGAFSDEWVAAQSLAGNVPEPGIGLVGIGVGMWLMRRR